jgi:hypothetical protein
MMDLTNKKEWEEFLQLIGKFVEMRVVLSKDDLFKKQIEPLKKEVAELQAVLANFGYRGVWNEGSEYFKGNFVTHDGSLFHCNMTTKNKPAKDPVSWSLCCKRGADGKDAVKALEYA